MPRLAKGERCDLDEIARDIKERDFRDMNRETAPLKKAEDAVMSLPSMITSWVLAKSLWRSRSFSRTLGITEHLEEGLCTGDLPFIFLIRS